MLSRERCAVASVVASLLLLVLWYPVVPQPSNSVRYAGSGSQSPVPNEQARTEGRQVSSTDEIPRGEVLPIPQTKTEVRLTDRTDGRQFDTKYEIPWGGLLPIPKTKTRVWIDIGTNINPIAAPSPDVYMILVDPIPNLVMNNAKAFPNPMDVAVVWSAISNRTGTATFNVYNKDGKSSSLASAVSFKASGSVEVPVHTLEELLNTIPKGFEIELLKTDMQGFDLVGLRSARGSLTRVKMITSEFEVPKSIKEYVGVDNSMTSAANFFKASGFSKVACSTLDCQYQNAGMCNSNPSICSAFVHKTRICRQFTVIEDKNIEKCRKISKTPFKDIGDKCTMCKPFG